MADHDTTATAAGHARRSVVPGLVAPLILGLLIL